MYNSTFACTWCGVGKLLLRSHNAPFILGINGRTESHRPRDSLTIARRAAAKPAGLDHSWNGDGEMEIWERFPSDG